MFNTQKSTTATLFLISFFLSITLAAQDLSSSKFGKGISIAAKDSSFTLKFSTRIQTLYVAERNIETEEWSTQVLTRRARLKFDGFAYSPRVVYKIELGLSNNDIAGGDGTQFGRTSNVILDAVLKYNFYKDWYVWFGQTKLPGNIERVISSQNLQFVDRSELNSRFNLDRDKGIQLRREAEKLRLIGSLSTGEGRNVVSDNAGGYDYTGRVEWLPFGDFTGGGDYSGSDLKREQTPKLFLAATYDYNDRTNRQRGQLGSFMENGQLRTMKTLFFDLHFKYKGLSTMIEYADREVNHSPLANDFKGEPNAFYVGRGLNVATGYLFKNNIEIAARYTEVTPDPATNTFYHDEHQYTLGLSKYVVGHSLKIQSDFSYLQEDGSDDLFRFRFQVEMAL